jgi:hypothetical protein
MDNETDRTTLSQANIWPKMQKPPGTEVLGGFWLIFGMIVGARGIISGFLRRRLVEDETAGQARGQRPVKVSLILGMILLQR